MRNGPTSFRVFYPSKRTLVPVTSGWKNGSRSSRSLEEWIAWSIPVRESFFLRASNEQFWIYRWNLLSGNDFNFDLFKASCKLIINVESKKVYAIDFIYLFIKYPVSLSNIYIQRALKLIMCKIYHTNLLKFANFPFNFLTIKKMKS